MKASPSATLRDYSADPRILYVSALAAGLGAVTAVLAWALLEAIALSTNLFYFQRWSFVDVDPWQGHLGWWRVFLPVLGGLLVGLIARYGSPRVRGHGMPEAVETIVFNGGKVQPRVAILKPLATAISIGSGGPFGAEGPVIMTGGAVGSVLGQLLPMTDSERTVLMVSGAAAVMAATFNCPMSAVLLAVEILLFEWKPRSLVPTSVFALSANATCREAAEWLHRMEERGAEAWSHWQRLFPLVEPDGTLAGLLTRTQMMQAARQSDLDRPLLTDANRTPATMAPTDTLRQAATVMAESKLSHYPIVESSGNFVGLLTIEDLLLARSREALREGDRNRVLRLRWPFAAKEDAKVAQVGEKVARKAEPSAAHVVSEAVLEEQDEEVLAETVAGAPSSKK